MRHGISTRTSGPICPSGTGCSALYVTSPPETLRFGTAEQDSHRYLTLYSLILMPFVDTARKLMPASPPRRVDS